MNVELTRSELRDAEGNTVAIVVPAAEWKLLQDRLARGEEARVEMFRLLDLIDKNPLPPMTDAEYEESLRHPGPSMTELLCELETKLGHG